MDAQQALHFQNHTFDDYRGILSRKSVVVRPLLRFFRPLIVTLIERKSPRWGGKAA
jgi:hypothetical protein